MNLPNKITFSRILLSFLIIIILLFPFVFLLEYLTEFPTFYLLVGWCLFFVVGVGQALLRMIAFCYKG